MVQCASECFSKADRTPAAPCFKQVRFWQINTCFCGANGCVMEDDDNINGAVP